MHIVWLLVWIIQIVWLSISLLWLYTCLICTTRRLAGFLQQELIIVVVVVMVVKVVMPQSYHW